MGFWKNVDDYLKFVGISRKELAFGTGIKEQTVDRAILRDSEPKLLDGLKVSSFLNIPVEKLLDAPVLPNTIKKEESENEVKKQISLYRKHHQLIDAYEKLNTNDQEKLSSYAAFLAERKNNYKISK